MIIIFHWMFRACIFLRVIAVHYQRRCIWMSFPWLGTRPNCQPKKWTTTDQQDDPYHHFFPVWAYGCPSLGLALVPRYSTHGSQKSRWNQKNREKMIFRLNFEVLLIRSLWNFTIAIILNLKMWIHKNFVCQLQGHENWAYFYVMEAKNGLSTIFFRKILVWDNSK